MTRAQKIRRLERGRARRRRLVAMGLRTDGKPRAKRKPCGCLVGRCHLCAKGSDSRYYTKEQVQAMWKDYESGMSRCAVERKHGVAKKGLQRIFEIRGYKLRPCVFRQARRVNGTFVADPPKTIKEINRMISKLKRINVPDELKHEWRLWPMSRREWFIKKARKHLKNSGIKFAPTGPCSSNVQPFDYWTPAAREIVDRLNAGRNSRNKLASLKPSSQGLIYKGILYFWASDCYVRQSLNLATNKTSRTLRPCLNIVIYEENFGAVPAQYTVIHKDGNKNNFDPKNLGLRSMADCARMNQVFKRLHENPSDPVLKAKAQYVLDRCHEARRSNIEKRARVALESLLNPENSKLIETITA